jgi:hypothetical protein
MKKLLVLPLMLLAFVACENDSVKRTETRVIDEPGVGTTKQTIETKEIKDDATRRNDDKMQQSVKSAQDAVNSAQNAAQSARDAARNAQDALRNKQ